MTLIEPHGASELRPLLLAGSERDEALRCAGPSPASARHSPTDT
jgi:hypothetical protein